MSDDLDPTGDGASADPTPPSVPPPPPPPPPPAPPSWAVAPTPPSWAEPGTNPPGGSAGDQPSWSTAPPPPPAPPKLRPLGVGEILDGAIKVWRTDFRRLFPYVALFSLPAQIAVALLRLSISSDGSLTTTDSNGVVQLDGSALRATIGGIAVITLITLLSTLVITAALTAYLTDRILDRPADLKACLRVGWSRLLPLIGVGLLVALGAMAGFLACVVPGIILLIRWNFASQIVVVERARPISAMKRSFWLTAGRFWPVLAIVVVSALLTGIISSIFSGILNAIVISVTGADSAATAISGLVTGTIASGLTLPFSAAVSVITYLDLRVRREGLDLQLLAQGISPHP